jgi:hypothetical protein
VTGLFSARGGAEGVDSAVQCGLGQRLEQGCGQADAAPGRVDRDGGFGHCFA